MKRRTHILLGCWIFSHIGHAVLSVFYEASPAAFYVPLIHVMLILLLIGTWRGNRIAAWLCLYMAIAAMLVQGGFIWMRDAYGALSIPVLVFDIMEFICAALYLIFFVSLRRWRCLPAANKFEWKGHTIEFIPALSHKTFWMATQNELLFDGKPVAKSGSFCFSAEARATVEHEGRPVLLQMRSSTRFQSFASLNYKLLVQDEVVSSGITRIKFQW